MTPVRLAYNELLRLTAGRLPTLVLAALLLVPVFFGGLYLYATWNPYAQLGNVPVALVNSDQGARDSGGKRVDAGDLVTEQLRNSDTFAWHPTDAGDAAQGVTDGDYAFAVTLPERFSASLLSDEEFPQAQGRLRLATNHANADLVRTVADRVIGEVRETVATRVGRDAADRLRTGYAAAQDQLSTAERAATTLADSTRSLDTGAGKRVENANSAAAGVRNLTGALAAAQRQSQELPGQTSALAAGSRQVADDAAAGADAAEASSELSGALDGLSSGLADRLRDEGFSADEIGTVTAALGEARGPVDEAGSRVRAAADGLGALSARANDVADGAEQLAAAAPEITSGVSGAAAEADTLTSTVDTLRQREQGAARTAGDIATDTASLRDGLASGVSDAPTTNTMAAAAPTAGDPVTVRTTGENGAPGASLAPFLLAVAAWVGGMLLFLLFRPLSTRALHAGRAPVITALGGVLMPAVAGVAQVVVLYAVALLVGLRPAHPVLALGFLVLTSLAFVALLHGLHALFGAVGKGIGVLLLVLQLATAGGVFPWQTIPEVLYPLHLLLPMGYTVDGLRQFLEGGSPGGAVTDVLVLLVWLAIGFGLTLFAASRNRKWTPERLRPELAF